MEGRLLMGKNKMPTSTDALPKLTAKKLSKIIADPVQSAEAVNLLYVTDSQPGITRLKKGNGFTYVFRDKKVIDKDEIKRIRSLVIPPAWQDVWICAEPIGHLQATGKDKLLRKQYRYHPVWNALRNHTKFFRLYDFGNSLPAIRLRAEKDLALPELPPEKVLALVVSLMQRTNIRVGNSSYEKLYGSFGITTLKDKHVTFNGHEIRFRFKGKKGVEHDISIKSKRLASIVKTCQDIPGKELFQYIDKNGNARTIDSGMVNSYIKHITGKDFTAKDFRTWSGSVQALLAFRELGSSDTITETKRRVVEALDKVSEQLGNTRTVCKKYYVHPAVITLYESNELDKYFEQLEALEKDDDKSGLTAVEKMLMKILEKEGLPK
jgi:DNA topoisomerase-1